LLRAFSFDLHVLGTPPALILSQDQTLSLIWLEQTTLAHRRSKLVRRKIAQPHSQESGFLACTSNQIVKEHFLDLTDHTRRFGVCQGGLKKSFQPAWDAVLRAERDYIYDSPFSARIQKN
jgi:hypothetical protein